MPAIAEVGVADVVAHDEDDVGPQGRRLGDDAESRDRDCGERRRDKRRNSKIYRHRALLDYPPNDPAIFEPPLITRNARDGPRPRAVAQFGRACRPILLGERPDARVT